MIGKYISWVREGNYEEGEKAWYIVARDQIHENFIGTITSICLKSSILLGKPIIGFAYTQEGGVKVSGRAPEEWIKTGLNLKEVFDYITRNIGGESGGHAGAAGATIPKDKIEEFKEKYETYLEENIKVEYK
jgi:single-stranded-DNA-specific exonuclease